MSRAFVDTNVVVYAFIDDPRADQAAALIASRCAVSVQVLNEFAHVGRRKLGFTWPELRAALAEIQSMSFAVVPLNPVIHQDALRVAERYNFSIYDALIVAAALSADCDTLYSEDLKHGQVIDGRLKVVNPFVNE